MQGRGCHWAPAVEEDYLTTCYFELGSYLDLALFRFVQEVDVWEGEMPEGAAGDALTEDDELDRHPAMLPAVQLVERGALLWDRTGGRDRGAADRSLRILFGACALWVHDVGQAFLCCQLPFS